MITVSFKLYSVYKNRQSILVTQKVKDKNLNLRMRQKADNFTCNFESEGKRKIENNKKGRS